VIADPLGWEREGGYLVLRPVFRIDFVKFGGLLALVVLSVSSNVYPGWMVEYSLKMGLLRMLSPLGVV